MDSKIPYKPTHLVAFVALCFCALQVMLVQYFIFEYMAELFAIELHRTPASEIFRIIFNVIALLFLVMGASYTFLIFLAGLVSRNFVHFKGNEIIITPALGIFGKREIVNIDEISCLRIQEMRPLTTNPLSNLIPTFYRTIHIIGKPPKMRIVSLRGNYLTKKDYYLVLEKLSEFDQI